MDCPKCGSRLANIAAHGRMVWVHAFLTDETPNGCVAVGLSKEMEECPNFRKYLLDDASVFTPAGGF